jgi:hypothetical protein
MKQLVLAFSFFSAFFTTLIAQTEPSFSSKLIGKSLTLQQEKVYLSFDKPYYSVGETMWFKVFAVDATTHTLDTISSVLYVDFIDEASNRLMVQQKLKIVDGTASGSYITEGGKSGRLLVRAYTRWMRNMANDYHFNKVIQVFDATKGTANAAPQSVVESVQFFPEGGDLVEGLPCNVAFKATDDNGKGIAIKGAIVDETGAIVANLSDDFNGMGRFTLKPEAGKKYSAKLETASKTFNLPAVATSGLALTVDNSKADLPIRLFVYLNYSAEKMPSSFTVLAHQRGKVAFANQVLVKDKANFKTFKGVIPRANFDEEGIVAITIFDDKGTPLAERLVFLENKNRHLNINLKTNKTTYNKREQVTVDVETTDAEGKPTAANISFGVLNSEKVSTPQYVEDLRAYMLLSSDLKGNIEKPSYYFEDTTATARRALDNLLMTQGWRRFAWQKVLAGKTDTVKYLQEFGMSLNGAVYKRKQAMANATLLVTVNSREEGNKFYSMKTDKNGRFSIDNMLFTDTAQVRVKIADVDKSYTVDFFTPPPAPSVADSKTRLAESPVSNADYITAARSVLEGQKLRVEREIQLQEIEIKAKKKTAQNDIREATYTAAKTFTVSETDIGTAYDYLRMNGVDLTQGDDDTILWRDRGGVSTAQVILDDFPASSSDLLILSTADIEKVNIVRNGVFPSLPGLQTFIHIFTKAGNPNYYKQRRFDEKDATPSTILYGYNLVKQFYMPNYNEQKPEYQFPDNRTTVYWSPMIKTDKTGKTRVSFFATDDAANMRILVEGLDKTGKLGVGKGGFKTN